MEKGNTEISSLRIALVTAEFEGPTHNGGIGTAFRELAETLRAGGHRVSVLFAGPFHRGDGEYWSRCLGMEGIEFNALSTTGVEDYYSNCRAVGADACQWLKERSFDIVHFHEWLALGLDTVMAKRGGEAFGSTLLCTTLHSPTYWIDAGNEDALTPAKRETGLAEQCSVENSDVVFSPSRYMLEHVLAEGWKVPAARMVMQNMMAPRRADGAAPARITELVFFGRLEKRKGLDIFCDAMDHLSVDSRGIRLAFLGRENFIDGRKASEYINSRAARWSCPWRTASDMNREGALEFLQVPGRLAVMPSRAENCSYAVLECIGRGIPFLASSVGGTPELIRKDRHFSALFMNSPEELARAIERALAEGAVPVPPEVPFKETREQWLTWHAPSKFRLHLDKARLP